MSFVVKGIDYPKCCAECHAGLDDSGDYPVCRYTGEQRGYTFNTRNRKMDKCPLGEIPTPHGRLIDADAFKVMCRKAVEDLQVHTFICPEDVRKVKVIADATEALCQDLDEAPTIIEAEE